MALRVPERGRDARAVARAGGRRCHNRARRHAAELPHRADRIRVRSCRGPVRRGRRVPRAHRAAWRPSRAHRLAERRSAARRGARGPGATHRGGARVGMTCVVVGAGLTGLSAAWELTRAGGEVLVLESERRAGGVVVTERREGFLVEGGPDGFLAADGDIQALARELGLGDRLVDQRAKGAVGWTGERLEATPLVRGWGAGRGAGGGRGGRVGRGRRLEPLPLGRAAELLGIEGLADVGAQHAAPLQGGFRSFAGGMTEISEALTARLHAAIRTAQGVTGIAPSRRGWRLAVTGGSQVEAEGVILAVPAWVAARLLATVGLSGARDLDSVVYSPSITVSLAYRTDQLNGRLDGTGFVSAPQSDGPVRACTYAWLKYPGRAPPGFALLRAFLGPVDGDPAALAHGELATLLALSGSPVWSRAFHCRRGLPRYKRGHAERVAHVREQLGRLAPLDIAGAGFDGAGVSACVKSGREAARRVLKRLGSVRG